MFDLNPLNLPDAQLQQWIMMIVAGTLGFFIGYASHNQRIARLQGRLVTVKRDLEGCHRSKIPVIIQGDDQETTVLNRIRSRSNEINFTRIGMASVAEADDLKEIIGIGPFLEKKLNAIGIYTFRQIARFTKEDIDTINDIIEFFPGRIKRDNWVRQAADLIKEK
jgi:predicted flap endonuclease-1-like 5' DNA nuclease